MRTLTEISKPLIIEMTEYISGMTDGIEATKKLAAKYSTIRAEFYFSLAAKILNDGIPFDKFVRGYLYEDYKKEKWIIIRTSR